MKSSVSIMMEGAVKHKSMWKVKNNLTLKIKEVNNLTINFCRTELKSEKHRVKPTFLSALATTDETLTIIHNHW